MRLTAILVLLISACALSSCGGVRLAGRHRTRGWHVALTEHVRLHTDVDPQDALETAWALEDLHRALAAVFLDCPPVATLEPTDVVMLAEARDYIDIGPPHSGGFFTLGRTGVGAIPPRIVVPASGYGRHVNVVQIFVHELTHRFVHACFPDVPVWLNEGLASYFETLRVRDDAVLVGIAPYRFADGGPRELVRRDGAFVHQLDPALLVPASTLVELAPEAFYAGDQMPLVGRANYAGAWALVHLLLIGGDADLRSRFAWFLERLRTSRVDGAVEFREAFSGRDLDGELSAYVGELERSRRRIPYTPAAFLRPALLRLDPAEVDLVWAELFIPLRGRERRALAHLARARADAFAHTRALLLLASLEPDAMRRRRLVDEAHTHDPDDREVLRARGWLEVERGVRDDASDALFAEISSVPDPSTVDLILRARLAVQGRAPSVALEAARAALLRDPTSPSARYALALAYVAAWQWDDARLELQAVLNATVEHDSTLMREAVRTMVAIRSRTAAPPPEATTPPAPPGAPEPFGPDVVVHAINTRRSAVQACYENALRFAPTLSGRVTMQLTIQTTGETTGVHIASAPAGLDEVGACIARVLDALSFDPGPIDRAMTYTFPFVFEPQS